jgi:HSP20 family protein
MFEGIWGYENPLSVQIRRLEQELDELFGSSAPSLTGRRNIRSLPVGAYPPLNVAATPDAFKVYLFAPGVDPTTLDISLGQNLLSVVGERQVAAAPDATHYRRERFSGEFRRSINVPDDADPDQVEARYVDGIVTITIGRRASSKPRQIKVA